MRIAGLGLCALLLAACGSTVPTGRQPTVEPQAVGTAEPADRASLPAAPSEPGIVGSHESTQAPTSERTTGVTTSPRYPASLLGPGVTDTAIDLGFVALKSYNETTEAAGLGQFTNDDTKLVVNAYLADVNRHGGVLGRRLRAVWAEYDVNSTQTVSSQEQSMCEAWTHDHRVFAAFATSASTGGVLDGCLTKAGVLQIGSYATTIDARSLSTRPLQYLPAGVSMERLLPAYVDGLAAAKWLDGKPVIALISMETPVFRRAGTTVAALLHRRGLTLTDSQYLYLGDSNAEAKQAIPQLQNALLRFRSEGVTHILVLSDIGDVYLLAATDADGQRWNPHWATTSPSGAALEVGTVPEDQLATTVQVGWLPLLDRGYRQGTPTGPGYARCLDVLRRAGIAPSSDQAAFNDAALCEEISFLVEGLRAGGTPHATTFRAGVAALKGFPIATAYGATFPGRPDGATSYRVTAYRRTCSCFEFVTTEQAM
jgi:hypothetical protein